MGGFFPLAPTPLYTIAIYCTDNIVLVDCTNKKLKKKKITYYVLLDPNKTTNNPLRLIILYS
jgi:hypothetical protein